MSSGVQQSYLRHIGTDPDTPNPFTLREAILNHNCGRREYNYTVAEFFDMFYEVTEPEQRLEMLADEPPLVLKWCTSEVADTEQAYLGGIAEWLSNRAGIPAPAWTEQPSRFNAAPIYPDDNGQPHTDAEKAGYRKRALPEFARRNDFTCDRLHERGFRWIMGFDPKYLEQLRQSRIQISTVDRRANRVLWPLYEENHNTSAAEVALRRAIASDCLRINAEHLTLEQALAKHGTTAEALQLDLSPVLPLKFKLPAHYGRISIASV